MKCLSLVFLFQVPHFKAQPLPHFDTVVLPEKKKVEATKPEPFRLLLDERGAVKSSRWEQMVRPTHSAPARRLSINFTSSKLQHDRCAFFICRLKKSRSERKGQYLKPDPTRSLIKSLSSPKRRPGLQWVSCELHRQSLTPTCGVRHTDVL